MVSTISRRARVRTSGLKGALNCHRSGTTASTRVLGERQATSDVDRIIPCPQLRKQAGVFDFFGTAKHTHDEVQESTPQSSVRRTMRRYPPVSVNSWSRKTLGASAEAKRCAASSDGKTACEDAAYFTKHRDIFVIRVENIKPLMSLACFNPSAVYLARRSELLRKCLIVPFFCAVGSAFSRDS